MNIPERLRSRKFFMAVVASLLIIANEGLGMDIPAETVTQFAAVVASYLIGQGIADSRQK